MAIERCRVPGPSEDAEWQSPVFNTSYWQYLSEPGVWPMHVSQFQWTRQSRIVLHKVCNRASCSCNKTFFMPWMKIDWWFYLNHQCRLIVFKVLCLFPLPKPSQQGDFNQLIYRQNHGVYLSTYINGCSFDLLTQRSRVQYCRGFCFRE